MLAFNFQYRQKGINDKTMPKPSSLISPNEHFVNSNDWGKATNREVVKVGSYRIYNINIPFIPEAPLA